MEKVATELSPLKQAKPETNERPASSYYHTREITRADKALLLQSGIRGILDDPGDVAGLAHANEEKSVEAEISDKNVASVFLIQFLAIKPSQNAIFRDSLKPLEAGAEHFELPSKVYFTLNFFDFPLAKTETLSLEKPKDTSEVSSLIYGIPYYLVRESFLKAGTGAKEEILRYEIDPSLKSQINQHIEFAKYLFNKSLTIDIWDADSLMLFGSVKVPLRELMKQGKPIASLSREYDIIHSNILSPRGGLQLLIKNVAKPPAQEMPSLNETNPFLKTQMLNPGKKKVKSKQKITLPEPYKKSIMHYTVEEANNPDLRKQERISRYKLASIEMKNSNFANHEEYELEKIRKELREINNFRETKKISILKSSLLQQFNEERTINVSFGRVEIISLEVINHYEFESVFTVNIEDPDERFLPKPEFSIVSNPTEWKYWVEKKGFVPPPEWSLIASGSSNFVLKAGESVEILVKFLTMRNYTEEYARDYKQGKITENDIRRKHYIGPRTVHLSITHSNGRIMNGTKVQINPHAPIVDHTFRFYEQENTKATLYLPALYHHSAPPTTRPVLTLNYAKAVVDWLNDKEIALQLDIPSEKSVLKFNLLAYNDVYYAELIGNWVIEIHAYPA